jgi:hypothetical protein
MVCGNVRPRSSTNRVPARQGRMTKLVKMFMMSADEGTEVQLISGQTS